MIGYRNKNSTGHIIDRGPDRVRAQARRLHHHAARSRHRHRFLGGRAAQHAAPGAGRHHDRRGAHARRHGPRDRVRAEGNGHLVLCTLHANNANQAMDRIINFFPEDRRNQLLMDLSLNLKGVVAQQLVPTPDGKGRRVADGDPGSARRWCRTTSATARSHKLKEVMKDSTNLGMRTFDQALFELYQAGEISYEMRCATRIRRTRCACASSSRRAATRARWPLAWAMSAWPISADARGPAVRRRGPSGALVVCGAVGGFLLRASGGQNAGMSLPDTPRPWRTSCSSRCRRSRAPVSRRASR